jgi:hypothetical protein
MLCGKAKKLYAPHFYLCLARMQRTRDFKSQLAAARNQMSSTGANSTFSPGLKGGNPLYGHVSHLKASPR